MLFVDSFPHLDIYLIKEAMILLLNKIASNMACWVFLWIPYLTKLSRAFIVCNFLRHLMGSLQVKSHT